MACNLATNFEAALIKTKLWQCSVLSRTPRVAVPSPPPPLLGRGRILLRAGYLGIPAIFQLVCHAFLSITFAFSGYSRSVEARNCRSDRRETGTQIGQIGKNRKPYRISNLKTRQYFFAETENQMLKNGISANRNEHQNRKNRSFWVQKPKNRSKNGQNRKTKNPMPPSLSDVTRKRSASRVIYGIFRVLTFFFWLRRIYSLKICYIG